MSGLPSDLNVNYRRGQPEVQVSQFWMNYSFSSTVSSFYLLVGSWVDVLQELCDSLYCEDTVVSEDRSDDVEV